MKKHLTVEDIDTLFDASSSVADFLLRLKERVPSEELGAEKITTPAAHRAKALLLEKLSNQSRHDALFHLIQAYKIETGIEVGDYVEDHRGRQFKVNQFICRYGVPRVLGNQIKKDGTPGAAVREIYEMSGHPLKKVATTTLAAKLASL